jgi:predicted anti-sigma-YlaC factor YlaD
VSGNTTNGQGRAESKLVKCEDIQPLIFGYMNHELGEGRTAVVREHVRKCKACQATAKDIQATLDLLHAASKTQTPPAERLSEKRRERIFWAFSHPVMDWLKKNLLIVSLVGALIVGVAIVMFYRLLIEKHFEPIYGGEPSLIIEVTHGRTNVIQGTNTVPPEEQK